MTEHSPAVSLNQGSAPIRIELKIFFKFQFKFYLNLGENNNK